MENLKLTPTKAYAKGDIKCRLCLDKCDRFIRLFGKAGRSKDYVSKIVNIFNIKIVEGDDFSDVLCQKCTRFIDKVDVFKNQCLQNQIKLREHSYSVKRVMVLSPSRDETATASVCRPNPKKRILPLQEISINSNTILTDQTEMFSSPVGVEGVIPFSSPTTTFQPILPRQEFNILSSTEEKQLNASISSKIPSIIADCIFLKQPSILSQVKNNILDATSKACKDLCKKKGGSLLYNNDFDGMSNLDLDKIFNEITSTNSFFVDVLCAVSGVSNNSNLPKELVVKFCFIYSILMNYRWTSLSLFQRVNTMLMIEGGGSKKLQERFNRLGVVLCHSRRTHLLNLVGGHFCDKAIAAVKNGESLRGTGDNEDLRILASNMRKGVKNVDMHLFSSNLYVNRVNFSHLPNDNPKKNLKTCPRSVFYPSVDELKVLKENFKIIVARIAVEFLPKFKFLKKVIPEHIKHQYSDQMSKKSTIIPLPTLDFNENLYPDCVGILRQYEKWIFEIYKEAGHLDGVDFNPENPELPENLVTPPDQPGAHIPSEGIKVPFSGDQLTRVRFAGSKHLLAGAHTSFDRFEHCYPFKPVMWHTKASLLQAAYSLFYDQNSANQIGTLKFFREKYNRKNVTPEKVLNSYDGCEELFISVGKAYIVNALLHFFNMESVDVYPQENKFPVNIIHKSDDVKYQYFDLTFSKFVQNYLFQIGQAAPVGEEEDCVKNYSLCFMYFTVIILQLKDTAAEGDGGRNLINQKVLLTIFKSLSAYSKYAIEMFVSIAQMECLYTERLSEELKWGFFSNWYGGEGRNVEDDLVQEICNGISKNAIKRMGANKNINAITRISRATAGIKEITECFDENVSIHAKSRKHAKRSSYDDEISMIRDIIEINPFVYVAGRSHECFETMKPHPKKYMVTKEFFDWLDYHKKNMSSMLF